MKNIFTIRLIMFLIGLHLCVNANTQSNINDSLALVDLYNSTNGAKWNDGGRWLTKNPLSWWWGVYTQNGRVTQLWLEDNNLQGTLPPSMSNLTELQYLNLGSNQLSGSIPSWLGGLSKLTEIHLNNNKFSDSLPSSLGNLSLEWLFLQHNQLSGSIPPSFGNLDHINYLELSYNKLSGGIPPAFGNIGSGQTTSYYQCEVYLSHNELSDSIPSSGKSFAYLSNIDVSYNHFTFAGMEGLIKKYPYISYSPQAIIPLYKKNDTLYVSVGGTPSNNTYYWYRDGILEKKTVGDSTILSTINSSYSVSVTNAIATNLTLYSDLILLPVTLLDFKVTRIGKFNLLHWRTSQDINCSYFNIERSNDGIVFRKVGCIKANSRPCITNNYQHTDMTPFIGKNYYRLQIVDKNGYTSYSPIRELGMTAHDLLLYPNPAKDHISISINSNQCQSAKIDIIGLDGKIKKTSHLTLAYGSNATTVLLNQLPPGFYIIEIISTKGEILVSEKFGKRIEIS